MAEKSGNGKRQTIKKCPKCGGKMIEGVFVHNASIRRRQLTRAEERLRNLLLQRISGF